MRHVTIGDAVKIAAEARKKWREVASKHFEFEILKRDGDYDIKFVSCGNKTIEFTASPEDLPIEEQGEYWKANIVGVRGGQVYTRSKSWATARDGYGRFRFLEIREHVLEILEEILNS